MRPDHCPVCRSPDTSAVDAADAAALTAGYAAMGVDISAAFASARQRIDLNGCQGCGLRWYTPAVAGDAAFYVALQQHDWYYQADKAEYAFASRHVDDGARLLEVGCGSAAFRRHLPTALTYRGLEFNDRAVTAARGLGLDVEIRAIEDEARERPGHYDVVCHFQVLEHVSAPRAFMQACAAALRPGGVLIVAVPAEDSFVGLAESSWLNMPPHHLTRWPDSALLKAFDEAGVAPGTLWHEPVAAIHRAWHRSVVENAGLQGLLGRTPRLVAPRGGARALARRLKRIPGVAEVLFRRGLAAFPQAAQGHSVCLVGRKR